MYKTSSLAEAADEVAERISAVIKGPEEPDGTGIP